MTQGELKIGDCFWIDDIRYQKIGETVMVPIDGEGNQNGPAVCIFPFDRVDHLES